MFIRMTCSVGRRVQLRWLARRRRWGEGVAGAHCGSSVLHSPARAPVSRPEGGKNRVSAARKRFARKGLGATEEGRRGPGLDPARRGCKGGVAAARARVGKRAWHGGRPAGRGCWAAVAAAAPAGRGTRRERDESDETQNGRPQVRGDGERRGGQARLAASHRSASTRDKGPRVRAVRARRACMHVYMACVPAARGPAGRRV